jgi:hypothetical protein
MQLLHAERTRVPADNSLFAVPRAASAPVLALPRAISLQAWAEATMRAVWRRAMSGATIAGDNTIHAVELLSTKSMAASAPTAQSQQRARAPTAN